MSYERYIEEDLDDVFQQLQPINNSELKHNGYQFWCGLIYERLVKCFHMAPEEAGEPEFLHHTIEEILTSRRSTYLNDIVDLNFFVLARDIPRDKIISEESWYRRELRIFVKLNTNEHTVKRYLSKNDTYSLVLFRTFGKYVTARAA